MGLTGRRTGSIRVAGTEAINLPRHRVAPLGVGYCPEERGIFASLSTRENLFLPPDLKTGFSGLSTDEIYALFPNLKERAHSPGTRLSGGEQQMLAVRAFCALARACCCSTRSPKGWPRSSCKPWDARSRHSNTKASLFCWLNRTSGFPPISPTAFM
jgi:amino acid/amide ABC transporter ATP-binding protein 2, HAAT family (TC 3.A.1.4.-)